MAAALSFSASVAAPAKLRAPARRAAAARPAAARAAYKASDSQYFDLKVRSDAASPPTPLPAVPRRAPAAGGRQAGHRSKTLHLGAKLRPGWRAWRTNTATPHAVAPTAGRAAGGAERTR
jgi:hypothetical protein